MNSADKNEMVPKPARIPPQTPPAGGKSAEAGRIHSPRQIASPCLVRISSFNHLDFARNSFELCPTNTARKTFYRKHRVDKILLLNYNNQYELETYRSYILANPNNIGGSYCGLSYWK